LWPDRAIPANIRVKASGSLSNRRGKRERKEVRGEKGREGGYFPVRRGGKEGQKKKGKERRGEKDLRVPAATPKSLLLNQASLRGEKRGLKKGGRGGACLIMLLIPNLRFFEGATGGKQEEGEKKKKREKGHGSDPLH